MNKFSIIERRKIHRIEDYQKTAKEMQRNLKLVKQREGILAEIDEYMGENYD